MTEAGQRRRRLRVGAQRRRRSPMPQRLQDRRGRQLAFLAQLRPVPRQARLQPADPHLLHPMRRVQLIHPVGQLLLELRRPLQRPGDALTHGAQLGNDPGILPIVLRGNAVERFGPVVRRLGTDAMHVEPRVAQRLTQRVSVRAGRFHRHPQLYPLARLLQQIHQRCNLQRIARTPGPKTGSVSKPDRRPDPPLADVKPCFHKLSRVRGQNLFHLHTLDRNGSIRFAHVHGDDLPHADQAGSVPPINSAFEASPPFRL